MRILLKVQVSWGLKTLEVCQTILDGQRESVSFKSLDMLFSTNFDVLVTNTHFEMFNLPWGMDGTHPFQGKHIH